jgi:hypothetical protein
LSWLTVPGAGPTSLEKQLQKADAYLRVAGDFKG